MSKNRDKCRAYSCNNITTTLIQISRLFYFGFFSKTNHPIVSRSKSKWYKAQKVQKYALNWQLQTLQILTNDDEVENWSLSSFLLAVRNASFLQLDLVIAFWNFLLYFVSRWDFTIQKKNVSWLDYFTIVKTQEQKM